MKVILTIKNIASGPFYLVSGKSKPDKYRFARVPTQRHLHQLVIDMKAAPKVLEDMALRTQQADIPVLISFEVEESDLDAGGALTAKDVVIAERDAEIKQLRQLVRNAEKAVNDRQVKTHGHRITTKELDMLKERDELLDLLKPFAMAEDTPVKVLLRLTHPPTPSVVVENNTFTGGSEGIVQAPPAMAEAEPAEEETKPPAKKKATRKTG